MLRSRERVCSQIKDWLNPVTHPWVRPIDWPSLPAVTNNKFVGLYAVYDTDTNFCTIKITLDGGATKHYYVDWGLGAGTEEVHSATTAEKAYTKGNYTTLGAGAYCSRGYRVAIVTVTVESGQNITAIDLSIRHTSENQVYSTQWLDISWIASACTSFTTYLATTGQHAGMLEQCTIGAHGITGSNFSGMFNSCFSLQSVPLFDTAAGTSFASMFNSCFSLQSVPLFDTASGSSFSNMFNSCISLRTVPLFNTVSGTNFLSMFGTCYSLESVPLFNTEAATSFSSMFSSCTALRTVPLFNAAAVTNFTSMFNSCTSLETVPLFNTVSGQNFSNMFTSCFSLQSVPLFNTAAATNLTTMFGSTRSLQKAKLSGTKQNITYADCRLSTADLVDIFDGLYDFQEVMTINVSPASDWVAGDVVTGQTSAKTCTVVSKIDATNYIVKTRDGAFTDAEEIGVTGTAAKLADQTAGAPTFANIEIMVLNVAHGAGTAWAAGDTLTGVTSGHTAVIVEKFGSMCYAVKNMTANPFHLDETLTNGSATANQGAANPIFLGKTAATGITQPTISVAGNWGAAALSAAQKLVLTNKGWVGTYA